MSAIEDTYVNQYYPTTNYYSSAFSLCVGEREGGTSNQYFDNEIYIKISGLVPNKKNILYLYCFYSPASGTFNVYESLPFDPKTITWDTKVGNKSNTPIYTIPYGDGWKEIPFTPTSDTFYIRIDETTDASITMFFDSMEVFDISLRPHLIPSIFMAESSAMVSFPVLSVLSHYSMDGVDYTVRQISDNIIAENPLSATPPTYEFLFYLSGGSALYVSKDDGFQAIQIERQYAELVSDNLNIPIYEPYAKIGPIKGYKIISQESITTSNEDTVPEKVISSGNCQYLYIRGCKVNYL
jgi:hypothetical protein